MNTTPHFARFVVSLTGIIATSAALCINSCPAQDKSADKSERIGIYDSRSIAVAFAGSPAHQQQLKQLKEAHEKATKAGDLNTVAKLEAEGKARQETMHKQAFSTAPVDDLLQSITNALPKIQMEANVTALISKWNEAELKKHPKAERIDVTAQLIDAFQPSEHQRKSALEIQKHKPMPIEEAARHRD